MCLESLNSGNEIAFSNRAIGKNMHSSIRNSPTITKSAFPDKTKMTTIYIKTKVTRTDIHTHAHVVSIDNAHYEYPGFSRAYERRVQSVHLSSVTTITRANERRVQPVHLSSVATIIRAYERGVFSRYIC